ncbi:MAG: DUF192 domain-containing protein [Armatimonadetes bacterium]|nr:DUF192 domain-containing protein [Armatimonadota bacterium]
MTDETRRIVLAERLETAAALGRQLVGLIGRPYLPPGSGLWLPGCNAVHTAGLRFPVDIVFVGPSWQILRCLHSVPPFRICLPVRNATHVIELPAGVLRASAAAPGDHLILEKAD